MIFADFESILAPEDNGKQNLDQLCTSRHQKHVACSKYCSDKSLQDLLSWKNTF